MAWVSAEHLDWLRARIDKLESELTAERAENRRREDFIYNMALRRAQTYPVPGKDETAGPAPDEVSSVPFFSPDDVGKAQAIRDEGLRLQSVGDQITEADIDRAIKAQTGMTLVDLRKAEFSQTEEMESVS